MSQKVTIMSMAQDLGVSHMTVSRALAGHPNVSAETRKAVLDHARALGYVRSAAASAMRGEDTRIVGLCLPNLANEFYARFANDFAGLCSDQGLDLIIHLTDDAEAKEQIALKRMREHQVRAVIMVPAPRDASVTDRVSLAGLRVIQMIRSRPDDGADAMLEVDDAAALRAAVRHLATRGRKRIGFIGAPTRMSSGRRRLAGYLSGLEESGMVRDETLIQTVTPSFETGRRALEELLDAGHADAVVCGGFELSNGALDLVMARGLDMPGELAFVGYGDPSFYRYIGGGITTIGLPVEDLTRDALALVEDDGATPPPAREARLILRGTA